MAGEQVAERFNGDGSSAAAARRFVARTLERWKCWSVEEPAVLLVSELVGNAVLHAGTEIGVAVRRRGDLIRVEVSDGSPVLPQRKYYSATSATGRGLALVESLSERWGAEHSGVGKTVWFELDASSPASQRSVPVDFDIDDLEELGAAGSGTAGPGAGGSRPQTDAPSARSGRPVDRRLLPVR